MNKKIGKYGNHFEVYTYTVNDEVYLWSAVGLDHLKDCSVITGSLNRLCEHMDRIEEKYAHKKVAH